jgi:hypothetical protein
MIRYSLFAGFCVAIAFACGGGSGSGLGNKRLVDLNDAEITSVCQDEFDSHDPRTVDCGDGITFDLAPQPVAECVAGFQESADEFPNCQATVGQFEACSDAIFGLSDSQLCAIILQNADFPAACDPLFTEECGGM